MNNIYPGAKFHVYSKKFNCEPFECIRVETDPGDHSMWIIARDTDGIAFEFPAEYCHLAGECPFELHSDNPRPKPKYSTLRDGLSEALTTLKAAKVTIKEGVEIADRYIGIDGGALIMSNVNGYSGEPDIDELIEHIEELIEHIEELIKASSDK